MKLDIKRLYIEAPYTWTEWEHKDVLTDVYLCYPDTDKNNFIYWCCDNCGEGLQMKIDFYCKIQQKPCSVQSQSH